MEVFATEPVQIENESDPMREDWGNGLVVVSDTEETGEWIMLDPEADEVNLDNWR